MKTFFLALQFLTIIPFPLKGETAERDIGRTTAFFPLVGLVQGVFLFGLNYMLVYFAEKYLTSGLVSVIFSLIIFLNVFFNWLILKVPVKKDVLIGGLFGVTGTVLIFKNE